eukprot:gene22846-29020_t
MLTDKQPLNRFKRKAAFLTTETISDHLVREHQHKRSRVGSLAAEEDGCGNHSWGCEQLGLVRPSTSVVSTRTSFKSNLTNTDKKFLSRHVSCIAMCGHNAITVSDNHLVSSNFDLSRPLVEALFRESTTSSTSSSSSGSSLPSSAAVEWVSMGPQGEFFVRYEDGGIACDFDTEFRLSDLLCGNVHKMHKIFFGPSNAFLALTSAGECFHAGLSHDVLKALEVNHHRTVEQVSFGGRGRYFMSFTDGHAVYCVGPKIHRQLKRIREKGGVVRCVYLGGGSGGGVGGGGGVQGTEKASAISDQGYGWYGAAACYTQEQSDAWKRVTNAVHAKGGKMFMQMWHMGRQSHSSFHANNETVFASTIKVPGDGTIRHALTHAKVPYETPRALRTDEIAGVVQDYKKSALLAKAAGFDGVEIHSANGYLIDGFLQSSTNDRTDQYGGSFENRFRFLKEIVAAVSEAFPPNRVALRLAPNGVYGGMGSADNFEMFSYVAEQLSPLGLAYLHVLDGAGFGQHTLGPLVGLEDWRKVYKGTLMGNASYTQETAEAAISSGRADAISFGRAYISNPDLVERFANNWPLAETAPYEVWWDAKQGETGFTTYGPYTPEIGSVKISA